MPSLSFEDYGNLSLTVFVVFFLSYCMYRIRQVKTYSPVFSIIQTMIVLDLTDLLTMVAHDPFVKLNDGEIIGWFTEFSSRKTFDTPRNRTTDTFTLPRS